MTLQSVLLSGMACFLKAAIMSKLEHPQAVLQAVCDVIELISARLIL